MNENLDSRRVEQSGILPSEPPISGAEYVTRALGLRLDVFMGPDGCFTPEHLGDILGGRLLTLVSRFDAGLPSDRELAKLRNRIPDDVRAAFAIPDDPTEIITHAPAASLVNDDVIVDEPPKHWAGRTRKAQQKVPGGTHNRKYKVKKGTVPGNRGPGRHGTKKTFY